MANPTAAAWTDIASDQEITAESPLVVKRGRVQLAVMRDGEGCLRALDNRCPHEGYPLVQGNVRDCTLTCAWHNFKFDLRDGACLKGDEAVTTYPVRVRQGRVEVDLTPPASDDAVEQGMARLMEGVHERRLGQIARQLVRMLDLGVQPQKLAMEAACFDAEHAQWGSSHALALASEAIAMLPLYAQTDTDPALPLMQVFDMASESCVRRPAHPVAEPVDPGPDPVAAAETMRRLVEQEQGDAAQSLLHGALERGWGRAEIEPMLYGPTCDHFLSFGHPVIYQGTVFDLLDTVGWSYAPRLLPGHLRGIIGATREDTLPRWRRFSERLAEREPRLAQWHGKATADGTAAEMADRERDGLWNAVTFGKRDEAFDAVQHAIEGGQPLSAIADIIGAAAAQRMLRFDVGHHQDAAVQEGWLDVTHSLTFAVAVRQALLRYRDPTVLRLLFFGARFVNNAATLDAKKVEPSTDTPAVETSTLDEVIAAVADHDPHRAVAHAAAYLAEHGVTDALRRAVTHLPLTDVYTRPIIVAHAIKTARAAFGLAERLAGTPWAHDPILAHIRFAASVERERTVAQLVHEAQRLVVDGKVPRALT